MTEGDEVITGSVEMTEADLARGIVESSGVFRARWLYIILFGAIAAGCGFTGTYRTLHFWISSAVVLIPFSTYVVLAPRLRARRALATIVAAGGNRVDYQFDKDGLALGMPDGTESFPYRTLASIRESATTLLLGKFIVPKRAFSPDDLERVRRLLNARLQIVRGPDIATTVIVLSMIAIFGLVFLWEFVSRPG